MRSGQGGGLYQSRDGAASWQNWRPIDRALHHPVRAVDVGERSRILAVACDDGFHVSVTAGAEWRPMPVPADGGRPVDVMVDRETPNIIYAVTSKGAYRSRDFGEEFLGQSWETLTEGLPPLNDAAFLDRAGRSRTDLCRIGK